MKKIIYLFCAILFLNSCYKYTVVDLNPNPNTSSNGGNFTAKVAGVNWSANQFTSASISNGRITIAGKSTDGKQIALVLSDYGVRTYPLIDTSLNAVAYTDSAFSTNAFASNQWLDNVSHGNVIVTNIDNANKKISGTFTANVKMQATGATRNITDGVFNNIPFTSTITTGGSGLDTFKVTNNGTLLQTNSVTVSNNAGYLGIQAFNLGGLLYSIILDNNITNGSYIFSFVSPPTLQITPSIGSLIISSATTGSNITILEHNTTTKRIRATFSGVCKELTPVAATTYAITQGYFSVKY
jgi:Family of unknown function (DUF6252)